MKLTRNIVLVTGGGSGIGRALAESLYRLGNRVIIAGRRREVLQAAAAANPGMDCVHLDQSDPVSIAGLVAEVTGRHPGLNVVINNAGIMHTEDLLAGDAAAAEETVAVNLLGPIRLTAALLPTLLAQRDAAIVNVTSALAFVPKAVTPTYCATKAALHSYTESLRHQLRDTAIEVVEVIPPRVETDIQRGLGNASHIVALDAFVAEAISLLRSNPGATEIVVDAARRVRFAAREDSYDEIFTAVNQTTMQK
ncbi:oxidoreductase [Mycobacterium sp. E1386]|uniref:SDR family oxidoreductase n=1 Tax=unclassified Mycobacterium TaxID=2642494 RepID=UPI000801845A|nr:MULTISPECIES: SDR family NAD(P)-dependent oxidoreductase [unclassified Mycobacterium]OBI24821.1 oxidoreductase [Mycobacterium sp. E1386]OBI26467.1 oxidoreductase [Mycobacterium sp. E2238]